jgi:hypothetical protein
MKTWEYITEEANSAAGMNKRDTVSFHRFNHNGAVAQLPVYEDFCHGDVFFTGAHYLYSKYENYYAKWLGEADPKKVTRWEINYAVENILEDAVKGRKFIAEKKGDSV